MTWNGGCFTSDGGPRTQIIRYQAVKLESTRGRVSDWSRGPMGSKCGSMKCRFGCVVWGLRAASASLVRVQAPVPRPQPLPPLLPALTAAPASVRLTRLSRPRSRSRSRRGAAAEVHDDSGGRLGPHADQRLAVLFQRLGAPARKAQPHGGEARDMETTLERPGAAHRIDRGGRGTGCCRWGEAHSEASSAHRRTRDESRRAYGRLRGVGGRRRTSPRPIQTGAGAMTLGG
jgi:hypothetical protein